MKFFIGITPPKEIKEKIIAFQRLFPHNEAPNIFEPHITVKAQSGLADDLSWLSEVKVIAAKNNKFEISFAGIGTFGESVVFLKPGYSSQLIELHKKLFEAIKPEDAGKGYFENEQYSPHLTLGGTGWGLNKGELAEIKKEAEKRLEQLPKFDISFIRVYRQLNNDEPYHKFLDLPFEK